MRLPRRGVLIRLFIYIPLIGFLGWRAYQARCGEPEQAVEPEAPTDDPLAPYRKTIVLPDGTQQEIVEMTPEQAEAVLGRPLPRDLDPKDEPADPATPAPADGETDSPAPTPADGETDSPAPADGDGEPADDGAATDEAAPADGSDAGGAAPEPTGD